MQLTKLGHACVRLEKDGGVLVIDPGAFSGDHALDGADAVLVTHEHFDHVVPDSMRAALAAQPGLRLWRRHRWPSSSASSATASRPSRTATISPPPGSA